MKYTNKPNSLHAVAAKYALTRIFGSLPQKYLARSFSCPNHRRVCIYYEPNKISYSQIYPFIFYQREIEKRHKVEIRFVPVKSLLQGKPTKHNNMDVILLQTWFTIEPTDLENILLHLTRSNPNAEISFLDSFAHNDLRLSRILDPYIRYYIKKSLFKDRSRYLYAYRGDTNLTDYYGNLYKIQAEPTDWKTPKSVLDKLRLGPNFFTASHFIWGFASDKQPSLDNRTIDIHSRLGLRGTNWYQTMRTESQKEVLTLSRLNTCSGPNVGWKKYMQEMRNAKLCFSPFGYGELCWRDIEAFATGAVLVKPDMSHLETLPDLYKDNETYFATNWDFSNLHDIVHRVIHEDDLRISVALKAHGMIVDYIQKKRFVDDISFLF